MFVTMATRFIKKAREICARDLTFVRAQQLMSLFLFRLSEVVYLNLSGFRMRFKTTALVFLLLSTFSSSVSQRKATPEEELEDVEKIVSKMADMGFHDAEADGMFEEEVDEILWDGLKEEHGESNQAIARKSYGSGKDETSGDIQEAVGEILVSNEMPKFYGEMVDVSKTTFTIKLSHEELPRTIPFYEIVVLKLSTDSEGYPRLPKENSQTWQTFIPYTKEPTPEHPYIAARFSRDDLPREFTVGDKLVSSFCDEIFPSVVYFKLTYCNQRIELQYKSSLIEILIKYSTIVCLKF